MSFTRNHYTEVARIIREQRAIASQPALTRDFQQDGLCAVTDIALQLSAMFAADNPRFDAARFAAACEPNGGGK